MTTNTEPQVPSTENRKWLGCLPAIIVVSALAVGVASIAICPGQPWFAKLVILLGVFAAGLAETVCKGARVLISRLISLIALGVIVGSRLDSSGFHFNARSPAELIVAWLLGSLLGLLFRRWRAAQR